MKNFSFILLLCAITLFSCTGKKKDATQQREEAIAEFRSHLTEADTTAMLKICDDAMEMLKQKKYDAVLASLYEYNDSTKEVKPLSDTTAKKYVGLRCFPYSHTIASTILSNSRVVTT